MGAMSNGLFVTVNQPQHPKALGLLKQERLIQLHHDSGMSHSHLSLRKFLFVSEKNKFLTQSGTIVKRVRRTLWH